MTSSFIDIHPHVISTDDAKYPHSPLFGVQSGWSKERPVNIDGLIKAMDEAGVQKAAIVQASTCYGFDNSYVCDAVAQHPGRFTVVGSVDMTQPDATKVVEGWMKRGLTGLRLFTGGSTTSAFDTSLLDDPRSFPVWSLAGEAGLPICLQTAPGGHAQIAGLAKRFPKTKILLDHLARPEIDDGAPYHKAASLFALANFDTVYLKITPPVFHNASKGKASPETFFPKLVAAFGASRLAWGSNFPATEGSMKTQLDIARKALSCLKADDQSEIFAHTAQSLYPALKD